MERHTAPRAAEHESHDGRSSDDPPRSSSSPALPGTGTGRQEPGAATGAPWLEEAGYLLAMLRLPVPAVGETRELACAVCLDDFQFQAGDKLRRMPCSHSFHQRCIFPWLRIRPRCPCCRHPLPAADVRHLLDPQPMTTHDFFLLK